MRNDSWRRTFALGTLACVVSIGAARGQATSSDDGRAPDHGGRAIASQGQVPIEVRRLEEGPHGTSVVLVNTGVKPIHEFSLSVHVPGPNGQLRAEMGSGQSSVVGWMPGDERVVHLASRPLAPGAVVVVDAALFADGTGAGNPKTLEQYRTNARAGRDDTAGVLKVLERFPDPFLDADLETLIAQLAAALAEAPLTGRGMQSGQQYLMAINTLKTLREPTRPGTATVASEVARLRNRLLDTLEVQRRSPALRDQRR